MEKVSTLKVNMLGEFSITAVLEDGSECRLTDSLGRSKKLWTLIEYLVCHRDREITQAELIELLWPEEEVENPLGSLKLIVHRARNELGDLGSITGKQIIVNRRGAYVWGDSFRTEVDVEAFEALCRAASSEADDRKLDCMLRAIELYKGDFLPKSASEQWVMPLNIYYHSKYINLCLEAVKLLEEQRRFDKVIDICQKAVEIDPYVESLHLSLILALAESGHPQRALEHYNNTTKMFMDQFGITPSEEFTAVYKQLVRNTNSRESDLSVVRERLAEADVEKGAFYCEYEFFKDIYRQKAREGSRTGQVVHLAMITMVGTKKKEMDQKQLNHLVSKLRGTIQLSLRSGDIFTRFSVTQFLLMLPSANYENTEMILERINRNFRSSCPKSGIILQSHILPLEPIMRI